MGIIEFMPSKPGAVGLHASSHNEYGLASTLNLTLNSREGSMPARVGPVYFDPPDQMDIRSQSQTQDLPSASPAFPLC